MKTRVSLETARRNGVRVTIKSLDTKLDALNRQNEKEEMKGFAEGGTAIDDSEEAEDLAEQIAMIERQKTEIQERELKKLSEEGIKKDGMRSSAESGEKRAGDEIFQSCSSPAETENLAAAVEKKLRALGLKCDISKSKGVITVTVDMPDRFKGQDPLRMSEDTLREAKEELDSAKDQPGSSPQPSSWAEYVSQRRVGDKAHHHGYGGGMVAG